MVVGRRQRCVASCNAAVLLRTNRTFHKEERWPYHSDDADFFDPLSGYAAREGRLECLKLLHQRGRLAPEHVPFNSLLKAAGTGGRREVAMWLARTLLEDGSGGSNAEGGSSGNGGGSGGSGDCRGRKPVATISTFATAAWLGCIPLMQLLRERGCPWGPYVWKAAAMGGCVRALEWLHEAGCPKPVRGAGRGSLLVPAHVCAPSLCFAEGKACSALVSCVPPWQASGSDTFFEAIINSDVATLAVLTRLGLDIELDDELFIYTGYHVCCQQQCVGQCVLSNQAGRLQCAAALEHGL
jgi:hypothetical protein